MAAVTFAGVATAPNGDLYVTWIDDHVRLKGGQHSQLASERVLIARSTDGGEHFSRPVLVAEPMRTAPSCRTGSWSIPASPDLAVSAAPTVLVDQARDRVDVVFDHFGCNGSLDVSLASFSTTLSGRPTQRQVNPPDGRSPSDQFLPAAAYERQTGDLWVCYYDTRADPQRQRARFDCQLSTDGGRTFGEPVAAASTSSDETAAGATHGGGRDYGDYESVVAANGTAHPFWTDSRQLARLGEEIYTTTLRAS